MSSRLPGVDPVVLLMDLLSRPKLKPVQLTPEQLAQRERDAERARWNVEVEARKAAKKQAAATQQETDK